jgi:hypothetical protein
MNKNDLKGYSAGVYAAVSKKETVKKAAGNLRDKLWIAPTQKVNIVPIARLLKRVRDLYGKAWLVGGGLTEGYSRRDFDIVITDKRDEVKIKKALGSLANMSHIIISKSHPLSPIVLEITGNAPEDEKIK